MSGWMAGGSGLLFAAALLSTLAAGLTVILEDRRWRMILLAIQYVCVGLMIAASLPMLIAAAKVAAGLAATTVMATAMFLPRDGGSAPATEPAERLHPLHWIAVGLVGSGAAALGWTPWLGVPDISRAASLAATILMGLGLLQVGVSLGPLRVGIGLLTLVSGFEIVYSTVEPSLVVAALLAVVHIGIALVVSYLLRVTPSPGAEPGEAFG